MLALGVANALSGAAFVALDATLSHQGGVAIEAVGKVRYLVHILERELVSYVALLNSSRGRVTNRQICV